MSFQSTHFARIGEALYGNNIACMLCSDERVKLVEDLSKVEMEDGSFLQEVAISDENKLPPDFKTALIRGAKSGSPLTGMTWLKNLTNLIDTSLSFDLGTDSISDMSKAILLDTLFNGPSKLNIKLSKYLSRNESITDFEDDHSLSSDNLYENSEEPHTEVFMAAIGLIGYWRRKGIELDCPLAKLMATLSDIGYFELIPMFNIESLEKVRPVFRECRERYGYRTNWFCKFFQLMLFGFDIVDSSKHDNRILLRESASRGLLYAMINEEWPMEEETAEKEKLINDNDMEAEK